jgi:hypothetical protein
MSPDDILLEPGEYYITVMAGWKASSLMSWTNSSGVKPFSVSVFKLL